MIKKCKTPGCENDAALKEYRADGSPKYRGVCNTCRSSKRKAGGNHSSLKKVATRKRTKKKANNQISSMPSIQPDSSSVDDANSADTSFIEARYAELRSRLLDLSRRNPLINFKHSSTGTRYIRVVDEVLSVLLKKLYSEEMQFKALPDVDEEPLDEKTEEFVLALEAAKEIDEEYNEILTDDKLERDDGVAYQQRLLQKDRELRNKIRGEIKLPPIQTKTNLDIKVHAKIHGFDPSYELTDHIRGEHHEDNLIQCLLTPDGLDRRLRSVYSHSVEFQRDTGINVLTAIFGFLEWTDTEKSETENLSPLILVPCEMTREKTAKSYKYTITAENDPPRTNACLIKKLSDLGIELPQYDPESSLAEYFDVISSLCENKKGWRVRRFVTVGICPFSTISIHNDLLPEEWPNKGCYTHGPVSDLFAARGSKSPNEVVESDDIDQLTINGDAPPIVMNADSSQHTAVRMVLNGESMVIEGPPGTGKSQTITNIIAASVAKGEKVLFVAEKQPALNVVSNRIKDIGLSPLVIEPQRKTSRVSFIESLRDRLKASCRLPTAQYNEARDKIIKTLLNINKVKHLLHDSTEYMGLSVYELIWRHIRKSHECYSRGINNSSLSLNIGKFTKSHYAELVDFVERYYEYVIPNRHRDNTLRGIARVSPNRITMNQFKHESEECREKVDGCHVLLSSLPDGSKIDRNSIEEFINCWKKHPVDNWKKSSEIKSAYDEATDLIAKIESARKVVDKHEEFGGISECQATKLAECLEKLQIKQTSITQMIEDKSTLLKLIEAMVLTKSLSEKVSVKHSIAGSDIKRFTDSILTITENHPESYPHICKREMLSDFRSAVLSVRDTRKEIEEKCPDIVDGDIIDFLEKYTSEEFQFIKEQFLKKGILSFLSPKFRRARKMLHEMGIRHRNELHLRNRLEALLSAQILCDKIKSDANMKALFGVEFDGIKSNLERLDELSVKLDASLKAWDYIDGFSPEVSLHDLLQSKIESSALSEASETFSNFELRGEFTIEQYLEAYRSELKTHEVAINILESLGVSDELLIDIESLSDVGIEKFCDDTHKKEYKLLELLVLASQKALAFIQIHEARKNEYQATIEELLTLIENQKKYTDALGLEDPDALEGFMLREDLGKVVDDYSVGESAWSAFEKRYEVTDLTPSPKGFNWAEVASGRLSKIEDADISTLIEDAEKNRIVAEVDNSRYADLFTSESVSKCETAEAALSYFEMEIAESILAEKAEDSGLDRDEFTGREVQATQNKFREVDAELRELDAKLALSNGLKHKVPDGINFGPKRDWTNLALIENECGKKKRFLPIRELVDRSQDALLALKPIWMMQPLAVSEMLPRTAGLFDLVIIDEASQMFPEMAIASILRCKRAVVVGDDKQMPPSSMFRVTESDDEESEIESESILDLASNRFSEKVTLRWHYRSQHESLISFSNKAFYKDQLEIIPSATHMNSSLGVEHIKVDGAYQAGLNVPEAKAVIEAVKKFVTKHPDLSIGIVTMNAKQRDLIEQELLRLADTDPSLREYFDAWSDSELDYPMIRSLERVQGDERDAIFISTVYGRDKEGKMYQRFPLINTEYGHRRLNVLFTRARRKVCLITSMNPSDIVLDEQSKLGKEALRNYIEYCATGRLETGKVSGDAVDSDFELAVSRVLERAGYKCTPQIGVRGFRIDLGVEHDSYPNGFLAGIECDGATYHSSALARDRDAIRQDVLESLGWKIYRVWSTDWFKDSERETDKMLKWLEQIRNTSAHQLDKP